MSPAVRLTVQVLWYYVGLITVAAGYAMIIRPGLGAGPWDIFHLGVAGRTGFPLFAVIQGTGLLIILLNLTLGIRPTVGMILNMLSVGPILQVCLALLPLPLSLAGRVAMLVAGILIAGLGTALYVSADLGSGPRDGMMIGLTRRLGLPVGPVKNGIDVIVALLGWWLGGPLSWGTLLVVAGLGPSMQLGMAVVVRLATYRPFTLFVHPVSLKRAPASSA